MIGRKLFGQVDALLCQAFPHCANDVFGGCSCLLFGDFGQLPPVMDLPLYTLESCSSLSDLGKSAYQLFNKAIVLDQVMRQSGDDDQQIIFHNILLRLKLTTSDWQCLMSQPLHISVMSLYSKLPSTSTLTVEAVLEHNLARLHANVNQLQLSKPYTVVQRGFHFHCMWCTCDANCKTLWVDVGLVNGL